MICTLYIKYFIHSFVRPFVHSSIRLFVHSFIVYFQKISMLPPQKVFCFAPPHPKEIIVLLDTFLLSLPFKTPLPLGISYDFPWGEYVYFLESHISLYMGISTFVYPTENLGITMSISLGRIKENVGQITVFPNLVPSVSPLLAP